MDAAMSRTSGEVELEVLLIPEIVEERWIPLLKHDVHMSAFVKVWKSFCLNFLCKWCRLTLAFWTCYIRETLAGSFSSVSKPILATLAGSLQRHKWARENIVDLRLRVHIWDSSKQRNYWARKNVLDLVIYKNMVLRFVTQKSTHKMC